MSLPCDFFASNMAFSPNVFSNMLDIEKTHKTLRLKDHPVLGRNIPE